MDPLNDPDLQRRLLEASSHERVPLGRLCRALGLTVEEVWADLMAMRKQGSLLVIFPAGKTVVRNVDEEVMVQRP